MLGKEVCNNYISSKGCSFPNCHRSHICLDCHESHPKFQCCTSKRSDTPAYAKPASTGGKWLNNCNDTDVGKHDSQRQVDNQVFQSLNFTPPSVNVEYLEHLLEDHPDKPFVEALLTGLHSGFHIGLSSIPEVSYECKNALSARKDPLTVHTALESDFLASFDPTRYLYYWISFGEECNFLVTKNCKEVAFFSRALGVPSAKLRYSLYE